MKVRFSEAKNINDTYKKLRLALHEDSMHFGNNMAAAEQMRDQAKDEFENVEIVYQKATEAAVIMKSNLEFLQS